MATKNCPHCSNQVPVACKKCVCGHTFFTTRRGAVQKKSDVSKKDTISPTKSGSKSPQLSEEGLEDSIVAGSSRGGPLIPDDFDLFPRRTTRIQREKPNFYDALEYDTQMRKQKMLLRRGGKSKSEEVSLKQNNTGDNSGSGGSFDDSIPVTRESKSEGPEPKKRRGRPPGLTSKKQVAGRARIQINTKAKTASNGRLQLNPNDKETKAPEDYDDIMNDITPEKALQYNIVLQEINRKWIQVGWKI